MRPPRLDLASPESGFALHFPAQPVERRTKTLPVDRQGQVIERAGLHGGDDPPRRRRMIRGDSRQPDAVHHQGLGRGDETTVSRIVPHDQQAFARWPLAKFRDGAVDLRMVAQGETGAGKFCPDADVGIDAVKY
ncbi:hypothetical protein PF049_11735 [Erythrobacteraceae bacterium WH01K]|nr:hypothetical protein PF049_11735 [Erythrobacteraceae bacterium WH01K]